MKKSTALVLTQISKVLTATSLFLSIYVIILILTGKTEDAE